MKIRMPFHLSDGALVEGTKRLACGEREATAQLVAHLAELDARRLYLGAGFPSLFAYCCEVLRLSEDAAFNRIEAARAARRWPAILEGLSDGTLTVTTARLLHRHLTADNQQRLLDAAAGRSKREVEQLVAQHAPRPDVPDSIRKVPVSRPVAIASPITAPTAAANTGSSATADPSHAEVRPASLMAPPPSTMRRPVVAPLAPDRYEVKLTVSAATRDKLRQAQDLLRHANPSGDLAEVVDRAVTLLLADLARKKSAATPRPRESRGVADGSRHIPAEVKRIVWRRDEARCAFVAPSGRRCTARALLELHHVKPYAAGGEATADNIALRCRAHNAYEAKVFFAGVVRETAPTYGPRGRGATRSGTGADPAREATHGG